MEKYRRNFLKFLEGILALIVLVAVIYFAVNGFGAFFAKDWSSNATFYQFISFVLLVLVGIELVRLIVSHHITTILELMILIISRKMLDPNIDALGILFSVMALAILIGIVYAYTLKPIESLEDLSH